VNQSNESGQFPEFFELTLEPVSPLAKLAGPFSLSRDDGLRRIPDESFVAELLLGLRKILEDFSELLFEPIDFLAGIDESRERYQNPHFAEKFACGARCRFPFVQPLDAVDARELVDI